MAPMAIRLIYAVIPWCFAIFLFFGIWKPAWRLRWGDGGRGPRMSAKAVALLGVGSVIFGLLGVIRPINSLFTNSALILLLAIYVATTMVTMRRLKNSS
jgi:hypothetical protein